MALFNTGPWQGEAVTGDIVVLNKLNLRDFKHVIDTACDSRTGKNVLCVFCILGSSLFPTKIKLNYKYSVVIAQKLTL